MVWIIGIVVCIVGCFLIPKATILHEVVRLPDFNYKAQKAKRDEMVMEKIRYGDRRFQYLVLFTPIDKPVRKKQVIVFFHGGGWMFGSPWRFRCNAQFFVDRGYAVIMPTYRRLPLYRGRQIVDDAQQALVSSMKLIRQKGWNETQIILSGMSAGGHLAAILALTYPHQANSAESLAGIMLFAPPLDLTKMSPSLITWWLAGKRGSSLFKSVNPVEFIDTQEKARPPVLLIHGTKDGLVNYRSTLSFLNHFGEDRLTFHTIPKGTHLDAGYWVFENNKEREIVLDWLQNNTTEL